MEKAVQKLGLIFKLHLILLNVRQITMNLPQAQSLLLYDIKKCDLLWFFIIFSASELPNTMGGGGCQNNNSK